MFEEPGSSYLSESRQVGRCHPEIRVHYFCHLYLSDSKIGSSTTKEPQALMELAQSLGYGHSVSRQGK